MVKLRSHKLVTLILLFIIVALGCENLTEDFNTPEYNNPIKVGVVGDVSVLREQVENIFFGIQLASEEINNMEGIEINNENRDIQLVYKNSAGSAEKGIKITTELINEGVDIIIGPTFSSVAVEMAEMCVQNNILMMSYSATLPELSLIGDNDLIWRTCPSDYTFGTISAQYSFDSLHYRNAAILYRDDRFGISLSEIIKGKFEKLGGNVSSYVSYPGNITDIHSYDFSSEINTLLAEHVDVVFIIAFNSEIAKITNEIYNNNLYQEFEKKPGIMLSDGIVPEELIINGNPELLETVVGITSTNEGNPNYSTYKANYKNRFGFLPATYSEHAYDALYCISYAMQRANSTNPNDIASYLREISGSYDPDDDPPEQVIININEFDVGKNMINKGENINYQGASGPINFDINGDPIPKFVIWGIRDNKFVELSYYGK
jgi:ABC-type branched-subunit amino acid transport system substrate-binding protein